MRAAAELAGMTPPRRASSSPLHQQLQSDGSPPPLMRNSAFPLLIVLEPEAAAVYCHVRATTASI